MANQMGVKLGVDLSYLSESISKAIDSINNSGKLNSKKLKLSIDTAKLTADIQKTLSEASKKVKPIKIDIRFSTNEAVKELQEQLNGLTLTAAPKLDGKAAEAENKLVQSVNKSIEAINKENEALTKGNDLLRIRETNFKSGDVLRSELYGDKTNTTEKRYKNGNITSVTETINLDKIESGIQKAEAEGIKLTAALDKIKAKYSDINAVKPIKDSESLSELSAAYDNIKVKIGELKDANSQSYAVQKAEIEALIADLEQLTRSKQNAEYVATSLRTKDINTIKAMQKQELNEFITKISESKVPFSEMQSTVDNLTASLSRVFDKTSLIEYLNQFDIANSKFNSVNAKFTGYDNAIKSVEKSLSALSKLQAKPNFIKNSNNEDVQQLNSQIETLKRNLTQLKSDLNADFSLENLLKCNKQLKELDVEIREITSRAEKMNIELRNTGLDDNLRSKFIDFKNQLQIFRNENAKAMKAVSPTGRTFSEELYDIEAAANQVADSAGLAKLQNQFKNLQTSAKSLGVTGNTVLSELWTKIKKFTSWMGLTYFITKARMYIRQLFQTVYELDTALVDLRKTFQGSTSELEEFYFESNKLAKQLGVTTSEIIKQASAWSKLGYSTNEQVRMMSQMSSMFASISPDMDVDTATNGLVSIMKAFKIGTDDVLNGILSKVNIVGNTAATSNGEIVEMLQKSSSAMKEANNTLEETIALETAAVEITRDASSVGNAYKTISMRLRNLDEETLETIDDVEILSSKIADATKTAKTPGGISLFTDASKTTYKSTFAILKELSEIWDDLTDRQTAVLTEVLGGKRQSQVVAATISNFEAAENALNNMTDSAGSAEAEMAIIRDSAEYLANQFKQTATSIAQHAVDRDDLKSLIKLGTSLLEIVDGIVEGIGGIPAILGTIIGIIGTKSNWLFGVNKETGKGTFAGIDLGKGWLSNYKTQRAEIKATANLVNELRTSFDGVTVSQEMANKVTSSSSATLKGLVSDFQKGTISSTQFVTELDKMSTNLKTAEIRISSLKMGIKSLGAAVGNIAVSMFVTWAISAAIGVIVKAVDNAIHAVKNLTESAKENTDAAKTSKTEIKRLNDELATTKKRLEELEKIKLTRGLDLFEQDEYDNLKKYNDELERNIKLETAKRELELQKANNDAKSAIKWAERFWGNGAPINDALSGIRDWGLYLEDIPNDVRVDASLYKLKSEQETQIRIYKSMLKTLEQLQDEQSKLTGKEFEKKGEEIKEFQKRLDSLKSVLMDSMSTIYQWQNSLNPDDPENKENLEYFAELTHQYEVLMGTAAGTFTEVWEQGKYTKVREELQKLAEAGELTAEKFSKLNDVDIDGIQAFKKELAEIGITDAGEIVKSIINEVKRLDKAADNGSRAVEDLAEAFKTLTDAIDEVIDKQEKLLDAFNKTRLGMSLTLDEVYELIKEMPEIAQYLKPSGSGFTISEEGFEAVNQANKEKALNGIEEQRKQIKETIKLLEEREELEKQIKELEIENAVNWINNNAGNEHDNTSTRDYKLIEPVPTSEELEKLKEQYNEIYKKTQDVNSTTEELKSQYEAYGYVLKFINEEFDENNAKINALNESYALAKEQVSDYNDEISAVKDAVKKVTDGEALSYDEMNNLIEMEPKLQSLFETQEDGYTISIDLLQELLEQSYKTRNDYIDDRIAETKAELEATKTFKQSTQEKIDELVKFGVAMSEMEAMTAASSDLFEANTKIDALEKILDKLQGLRKDLKDGSDNSKNDILDKLQEEIDRYKTILDAVSAVYEKYAEAVDNEIDVLEASKDALKDANDERQRELDLIEARNNLENAKKRKIWVYSDEMGFKQVADEGAIKEAEEKYRDAVTDIQIAEIDKAIAEKEKQKENLEESIKDLTEAEQNIQDSLTISKAMEALGLSDQSELLTLPESVKEGIVKGLAEATLQKDIEENKDNDNYTKITLDDLLKNMGAKVSADVAKEIFSDNTVKNQAIQSFVNNLQESANPASDTYVTNNNGLIVSPVFNIDGARDPQEIADVVNKEITDLLIRFNNSIK